MLSRALIRFPQFGQCDGGETIDSPRGTRQMTTLRKLPAQAPSSAAYMDAIAVRRCRLLLGRRQLAPRALHEASRTSCLQVGRSIGVELDRSLLATDDDPSWTIDRHLAMNGTATAQIDEACARTRRQVARVDDPVVVDCALP